MSDPHLKTAVSYARSATHSPSRLTEQHTLNAERALADGYVIPEQYRFGEFASGLDRDRPALQRLMRAIEEGGGPKRIYLTDLSRLSRSPEDYLAFLDRFARAGAEVLKSNSRSQDS